MRNYYEMKNSITILIFCRLPQLLKNVLLYEFCMND